MAKPVVTNRRTVEQIKHCVAEALSVLEHNESGDHAISDLEQARELIDRVLPILKGTEKSPR